MFSRRNIPEDSHLHLTDASNGPVQKLINFHCPSASLRMCTLDGAENVKAIPHILQVFRSISCVIDAQAAIIWRRRSALSPTCVWYLLNSRVIFKRSIDHFTTMNLLKRKISEARINSLQLMVILRNSIYTSKN
jgi:hypothetical protein